MPQKVKPATQAAIIQIQEQLSPIIAAREKCTVIELARLRAIESQARIVRQLQNEYFSCRKRSALIASKEAEAVLDVLVLPSLSEAIDDIVADLRKEGSL